MATVAFVDSGGKADRGDSGGGLTFVREDIHYIYGIVSTKLFGDEKNVRLFTNLMNDGHKAWLQRKWREYQVQHGKYLNNPKPVAALSGEQPLNSRSDGYETLYNLIRF